ncbi:MAG: Hsp20/alpha crystallin family protein [Anaerolineae bacterium]
MRSLIRWEPFGESRRIRRAMDSLFGDLMGAPRLWTWEGHYFFPLDVYETQEALVVKAALPGFRPDDVDISVQGDVLTIKGKLKHQEKVEGENYYRREMRHGTFSRSLPLPVRIDHEKAEAVFENGILTVSLPKAEEARPKSIKVRAKELIGAKG